LIGSRQYHLRSNLLNSVKEEGDDYNNLYSLLILK
jgi:hypothetical protein